MIDLGCLKIILLISNRIVVFRLEAMNNDPINHVVSHPSSLSFLKLFLTFHCVIESLKTELRHFMEGYISVCILYGFYLHR